MNGAPGNYQSIIQLKHFMEELEQGIRFANREIINKRIQGIDKAKILNFSVVVGRLRARYLEAAFKLSADEDTAPPDHSEIEELRNKRLMYEEARDAFEALRYAIERGYLDIEPAEDDKAGKKSDT